jgi:hypothetical protein
LSHFILKISLQKNHPAKIWFECKNKKVSQEIVNRVASSPLVTIDLSELVPTGERRQIDLKDHLYEGLMLREKDFRAFIKEQDWSAFEGKHIAIHCSADAVIPMWAYMMLGAKLAPVAKTVVYGNLRDLEDALILQAIRTLDAKAYQGKKLVIKGCGGKELPEAAYLEIALSLQPYASSIMYGEPCSTVPVYKQPRR